MILAIRLVRALWAFFVILASYLTHIALVRVFRHRENQPDGVRHQVRHQVRYQVPEWLRQRRERIDLRNARRLYRDILKLRGVYIKMGQVLSVLGGFLPKAFCTELEGLQDQVPPHPFSDVERTFLADMGRRPDQVFARIVKVPIAAASLGQVHEAYLADGTKVAVKVLYPHIRDIIRVDMRVLGVVIRVYQRFLPVSNLVSVHQSLIDLLRRETDYLHEAVCMERMAKNFEAEPDLLFPKVVHELTTRDILTMTFMEGVKITRLDELERLGVNKTRVATRLIQSFYKQLFVDHYFHADPHPGNFLVQAGPNGEPRIVVLDFGAVCEASDELIEGAMEILQALFTQNGDLALKGFRRMGFAAPEGNKELIEKTIMTYFKKLLRIEHRTANALMEKGHEELEALVSPEVDRQELRDLMKSFAYPEGWFYVERAAVLMFWLSARIDPSIDTMAVGFPYVMPLLLQKSA
jgi:predicted unusual protein kinase regulating ubiquinone biosynthesis (AarF/ABC1/UbiB family)